MGSMICWYGEKDGLTFTDMRFDDVPQVFYAVPAADEEKITATKGTDAKQVLRDKLAVLAYEFDAKASTADRFVMVRCPAKDKVPTL